MKLTKTVDLLIDGDLFLYKAAFGCEKEVRWDDENHLLWSNVEDAWGALTENLNSLPFPIEDSERIIALTGKDNFRKKLYPAYKGNRVDARKPMCYSDLTERLKENYRVIQYDGLEADDILGIFGTKPSERSRVVVSADKDLRSVPCWLYENGGLRYIDEEEANYNHMFQTLVGDQADNYPGCPGIGPVKAKAILDSYDAAVGFLRWGAVVNEFTKKGLTEEDALLQARLARILRDSDWDSEKKEPILWQPTQA